MAWEKNRFYYLDIISELGMNLSFGPLLVTFYEDQASHRVLG